HQRALGPSLAKLLVLGLLDAPRDRDDRIAALELGQPGGDVLDDVGGDEVGADVGPKADVQGGGDGHGFVPCAVVVWCDAARVCARAADLSSGSVALDRLDALALAVGDALAGVGRALINPIEGAGA